MDVETKGEENIWGLTIFRNTVRPIRPRSEHDMNRFSREDINQLIATKVGNYIASGGIETTRGSEEGAYTSSVLQRPSMRATAMPMTQPQALGFSYCGVLWVPSLVVSRGSLGVSQQ